MRMSHCSTDSGTSSPPGGASGGDPRAFALIRKPQSRSDKCGYGPSGYAAGWNKQKQLVNTYISSLQQILFCR